MKTVYLAVIFVAGATLALPADPDAYGGWTQLSGRASGYFHAEQFDGVWWLVTPDGQAFFSKGINHITYAGDRSPALGYAPYGRAVEAKYGSAGAWAEATAERLREWGFNTVGAWSSAEMFEQEVPYTVILNLAASVGADWQRGEVADVFAPRFREALEVQARKLCAPRVTDPHLLGYFTDNELRWGADWRSKKSLFEDFLGRSLESPGKQTLVGLLRSRYPTLESFNNAWGLQLGSWDDLGGLTALPRDKADFRAVEREFLRAYATAYFKACRECIRAIDPNHLILGCRFAGQAPAEAVEAMGQFVDVISFNNYAFIPPFEVLRQLHETTRKPIMLTEFSFKAMDSGLPNSRGAGKPVATQQDRADHFDRYVTALARMPFLVGYHWFQYSDQPAEGRFDGENSNYGVVNGQDEPWEILTLRMTAVNERIASIHRNKVGPGDLK